jgi:hypothetical protein
MATRTALTMSKRMMQTLVPTLLQQAGQRSSGHH